jgi:hypothetical protein
MNYYIEKERERTLRELEKIEGRRWKKPTDYYDHWIDALKFYAESHSRYGPK